MLIWEPQWLLNIQDLRSFPYLCFMPFRLQTFAWYLLAFNLLAFVVLGRLGSLGGHTAYEWLFLSFGIQLNVMLFLTVRRYLLGQRERLPHQSALSLVSSLPPQSMGMASLPDLGWFCLRGSCSSACFDLLWPSLSL